MTPKKVISNHYAKRCVCCGDRVEAHTGIAFLVDSKWLTAHYECEPVLAEPWIKAREERLLEREAKLQAEEAQKVKFEARMAELAAKLGVNKMSRLNPTAQQYAYNDVFEWDCPFDGDGTDEEFKEFLTRGPQNSWGQLRWSNGLHIVSIDRINKLVRMRESVSLAD